MRDGITTVEVLIFTTALFLKSLGACVYAFSGQSLYGNHGDYSRRRSVCCGTLRNKLMTLSPDAR